MKSFFVSLLMLLIFAVIIFRVTVTAISKKQILIDLIIIACFAAASIFLICLTE